MIESAVFILFLEACQKLGSTQSGLGIPTLKLGHSKQSFNSPATAAERNDRVLMGGSVLWKLNWRKGMKN